jgi:short-subunit dehydrogenase
MTKRLSGTVAVVTGASSGIGRATALELSKHGVNLILAARRSNLLEDVAKECRKSGSHAIVVPTEISDPSAVEKLANRAVREFGDFDIWINNAGVTTIGPFQDVPLEEDRRVIEVNVLGYIYGAKQAIRHFIRRGKGTLINVASIAGRLSEPYSTAYTASKHAVRGLGLSLRQELWLEDKRNIHVCTVLPAVIDTPLFQHAGNHTGHPIKAMPPVYPASQVAEAIIQLIESPQDEVFVGRPAKMFSTAESLIPWRTHKQLAKAVQKKHVREDLYAEPTGGNLFAPTSDKHKISGGWHRESSTPLGISTLFGVGALAAAALLTLLRNSEGVRRTATVTAFPGQKRRSQDRPVAVNETVSRREQGLDRTIADTFPSSDPPSSIPNPY